MKLPELPRVLKKYESDFAEGIFTKWLLNNKRVSTSFEIKDTRGKEYLNFKEVGTEQVDWGMAIKSDKGALIRVQGLNGQPDYIWARNMPAYIVIRYPKMFVMIDVETFSIEAKRSKRRSLTAARAADIAVKVVKLSTPNVR